MSDKFHHYIGLTREQAVRRAELEHRSIRVSSLDGVPFMLTMDWRPDRVNVQIENDKVVNAYPG